MQRSHTAITKRIGYHFDHPDWLNQALTHRSADPSHNERLEFLGDAILNAVISHELFHRHPDADEGILSHLKANLVNRDALLAIATQLSMERVVQVGGGEKTQPIRTSILANSVEALIGAIYLDSDYTTVMQWILTTWKPLIAKQTVEPPSKNHKTALQEFCQQHRLPIPTYATVNVSGPKHQLVFTQSCQVVAKTKLKTMGKAPTKRQAEQAAAQSMLHQLCRLYD